MNMSGAVPKSFNMRILGHYKEAGYIFYILASDLKTESNFKKKLEPKGREKPSLLMRVVSELGKDFFSVNAEPKTMHFLKIPEDASGLETVKKSILDKAEVLKSAVRGPEPWKIFLNNLERSPCLPKEELIALWDAEKAENLRCSEEGKEAKRAAAKEEAARIKAFMTEAMPGSARKRYRTKDPEAEAGGGSGGGSGSAAESDSAIGPGGEAVSIEVAALLTLATQAPLPAQAIAFARVLVPSPTSDGKGVYCSGREMPVF